MDNKSFRDSLSVTNLPKNPQPTTNLNNNTQKRNISNKPTTLLSKNLKIKITAAVLSGALLTTGIIAGKTIAKNNYIKDAYQANIVELTKDHDVTKYLKYLKENPLETNDFTYDGNTYNYTNTVKCSRHNLVNVLNSSQIPKILREYLTSNDQSILDKINEDELINLMRDEVLASFADSKGIDISDVSMDATFHSENSEHKAKIVEGLTAYRGNSLNIYIKNYGSLQADVNMLHAPATSNYKKIPYEYFDLLSKIQLLYEGADKATCFNKDMSKKEIAVDLYKELQVILYEHDFTIQNGKIYLVNRSNPQQLKYADYKGNSTLKNVNLEKNERDEK